MDTRKHAKGLAQVIVLGTVVVGVGIGVLVDHLAHSVAWGVISTLLAGLAFMGIGIALIVKGGGFQKLAKPR